MARSKVICPKCKSKDLQLMELWNNHITFTQNDGEINMAGNLDPDTPYKVLGICMKCGHEWTVKNARQIDDCVVAESENENSGLNIPVVSGSLLPTTLMRLHPELTYSEAESLMEFAKSHTITHEECYGDGSIIYPMWKEVNYR